MLQIIIPAAVLGAVAVGGVIHEFLKDDPVRHKILLIGPKGGGKTTWRTFLTEGTAGTEPEPTNHPMKFEAKVQWREQDVRLSIMDQSGDTSQMNQWKKACSTADCIFFFADVSRMKDDKYVEKVQRQAKQVRSWSELPRDARIAIVTSHADKEPDWGSPDSYSRTRNTEQVKKLRRALGAEEVFVGALNSEEGLKDMTDNALGWVRAGHAK